MSSPFHTQGFGSSMVYLGKQESKGANGLKNIGNTCFLNVVLQSLASVSSFNIWLQQHYRTKKGTSLGITLRRTIIDLCINGRGSFEPAVTKVEELKKKFLNKEQQDAHELMQFLLTTVNEEAETQPLAGLRFLTFQPKKPLSISSLTQSDLQSSLLRIAPSTSTPSNKLPRNPFFGILKNTMQCAKCQRVSLPSYQKFMDLSLSIPETKQRSYSLEDCLKYFTEPELVHDVDCSSWGYQTNAYRSPQTAKGFKCSRNNAQKRLSIVRAPRTLCLHLRRLVSTAYGSQIKLNCHVKFPLELDLAPYCSFVCNSGVTDQKYSSDIKPASSRAAPTYPSLSSMVGGDHQYCPPNGSSSSVDIDQDNPPKSMQASQFSCTNSRLLYKLVSVVVHHGSNYGGHYTVYRKLFSSMFSSEKEYEDSVDKLVFSQDTKQKEEWYHISDEHVSRVNIEDVLRSQAYMLYYERV